MIAVTTSSSPSARYSKVAVLLHWAIAALIIANLALGIVMEGLPREGRMRAVPVHVSIGFTVLALTVLRIIWRLFHRPPPLLDMRTRWEAPLAGFVHVALYAFMLFMPLTGWALISANPPPHAQVTPSPRGRPPVVWGLAQVPLIAPLQQMGATLEGQPRQEKIHDDFVTAHAVGGFTMIALLALHILGALKHEILDGQRELRRMSMPLWPGRRRTQDPT